VIAVAGALLALLLSALLGRLAIALAGRFRFLDHPGERKLQAAPVPLLGGAAVYAAVLAGALLLGVERGGDAVALRWLAGGGALLILGLADDRHGLSAPLRLAAQGLSALAFAPELAAWLAPAWLGLPLGLLWMVGLVNAFNFLDNMDCAAGSTGLWTALALSLVFHWAGQALLAGCLWVLAAALAGFLLWNRPPARLYFGDAGATFLGFSLAGFALLAVTRAGLSPWLAPLLLAVPLYDTTTVLWIRRREGRRLWIGDRRHVTHRLAERGAGTARAVLTINAWTLIAAAAALATHRAGRGAPLVLAAALLGAWLLFRGEEGARSAAPRETRGSGGSPG
jgi:UDP-GlcNAc:undecaprenyl-phosphate GlcNAc-1-phosphate transferase